MKEPRKIIFTKEGYQSIKEKYTLLQTERVAAVEQLKKARDMGDLSENGFYKASKQKLGSIDHELFILKHQIRYGIVKESLSHEIVEVGSVVTIKINENEKKITIVGEQEANPTEGKISFQSPLGKALLHKRVYDIVPVSTPRGTVNYTIKKIN